MFDLIISLLSGVDKAVHLHAEANEKLRHVTSGCIRFCERIRPDFVLGPIASRRFQAKSGLSLWEPLRTRRPSESLVCYQIVAISTVE